LSSETSAKRSSRLRRAGTDGFTTSSPSLALKLTSEPAPRPTSSAKPRGIRNPRLFPHFWTRVCTATQRLYKEYTGSGLQPHRPHLSNAPVQRRTAQRIVRCNRLLADEPINIFHSTNGESKSVASTSTSGSALNMAMRSPCNLTAASRTPVSMNRNFRQLQTRS